MNGEELKELLGEKLEEHEVSVKAFVYGDYDEVIDEDLRNTFGVFDQIYNDRTIGDGDYDGQQAVYSFKDHDVFIAIEGYYSSQCGTDFDDATVYVVRPIEVTTIEYRRV